MNVKRAEKPGTLPREAEPTYDGVRLPKGRLVSPDPDYARGKPAPGPVVWVTDEDVEDLAAQVAQLLPRLAPLGLWPFALVSMEREDTRPWLDGELSDSSSPDGHSPAPLLADWWSNGLPMDGDEEGMEAVAPFGRTFPGLAPATPPGDDTTEISDIELEGRLGIVAVTRAADAVAAVGWMGAVNHHADMGPMAAIFRSWEDRFGAHVVTIGFDTLMFLVDRPPTDLESALAIAAEHFSACPDNIHQGSGSLEEYASELVDSPIWNFWWD